MVVFKLKKEYPHKSNLEMSSLGLWNTPVVVRFSIPKKAFTRLGKANLLKLMARLRTEHKCTALKRESSGRALFRLVAEG